MKFNIYLTLKGPGGITEAPNRGNPVEQEDISQCLFELAESLRRQKRISKEQQGLWLTDLEIVGIRIEQVNR